jgi:hypothetical protein
MPLKSKPKLPPKHRFIRAPALCMVTAVKMLSREAREWRASLEEAEALTARYERAKA